MHGGVPLRGHPRAVPGIISKRWSQRESIFREPRRPLDVCPAGRAAWIAIFPPPPLEETLAQKPCLLARPASRRLLRLPRTQPGCAGFTKPASPCGTSISGVSWPLWVRGSLRLGPCMSRPSAGRPASGARRACARPRAPLAASSSRHHRAHTPPTRVACASQSSSVPSSSHSSWPGESVSRVGASGTPLA